jgi:hypothetical protein
MNNMVAHSLQQYLHIDHLNRPFDIVLFLFMSLTIVIPFLLFLSAVISVVIFSLIRLFPG